MSEILSLLTGREAALKRAADAARAGGLVVFPTDTVYGIGADAFQPAATARLFALKARPRSLPLPVLVSAPRQAWALAAHVPREAAELVAAFWPGALTIVVPYADGLPWDLGETRGTVGVRIPANKDTRDLIARVGPMAVTSANVSGEPTPRTAQAIAERFGDAVEIYLDGGEAPAEIPSTVVDLTGRRPRIHREGAIARSEVERILGTRVSGP